MLVFNVICNGIKLREHTKHTIYYKILLNLESKR